MAAYKTNFGKQEKPEMGRWYLLTFRQYAHCNKNKDKKFWEHGNTASVQFSRFCESLSASCRFKHVLILHFLRISPKMIDKVSSHCQMAQSILFSLEEKGGVGLKSRISVSVPSAKCSSPSRFLGEDWQTLLAVSRWFFGCCFPIQREGAFFSIQYIL